MFLSNGSGLMWIRPWATLWVMSRMCELEPSGLQYLYQKERCCHVWLGRILYILSFTGARVPFLLVCPVTSMGILFFMVLINERTIKPWSLLTVDEAFQCVTYCMNRVPEKWSNYYERGWHVDTLLFEWLPAVCACRGCQVAGLCISSEQ